MVQQYCPYEFPFGGSLKLKMKTDIELRMNDEIKKIRSVYFIGIGGIGMSAIARFFHSNGVKVSGYDRSETGLIKESQRRF